MKVQITINTDNAAFDNRASFEVCNILFDIADHIKENGFESHKIKDSNGNTVGQVIIK